MSKEKIIEYVMNSPHNTNRQVLEGLLDSISGEEYTVLLEETITTTQIEGAPITIADGTLVFDELINANNIKVTFDGTIYECAVHTLNTLNNEVYCYGGITEKGELDFSKYPFILQSGIMQPEQEGVSPTLINMLETEVPGVHSIKVEIPKDSGASQNDWSTAEVTFINTGEGYYTVDSVFEVTDTGLETAIMTVNGNTETSVTIPLYKNKCTLDRVFVGHIEGSATITGNIVQLNEGLEITGNGTISYKGTGVSN